MYAAKALVALGVPIVATLILWWATGTFNEEEFITLCGAFVGGILTYAVPNKPRSKQHIN